MTNLKNTGSFSMLPWLLLLVLGFLFIVGCRGCQERSRGGRILKVIRFFVQSVPPAPRWLDCQRPLAGIGLPLVAPARTATAMGRDVAGLVEGVIDTEQE